LTMKRRAEGLLLECMRCGEMKPIGRFKKRGSGPEGETRYKSHCKECDKPVQAASAARRRARSIGRYTAAEVRGLYETQRGACASCCRDLRVSGYHVDHRVAIARGGLNVVGNLQLLCPKCNLRKGSK